MFRVLTGVALLLVGFGWVFTAGETNSRYTEKTTTVARLASWCDTGLPVSDATIHAPVDSTPSVALTTELAEEYTMSLRSACKRSALTPASHRPRNYLGSSSVSRHSPNWLPSFLPISEFCTVLSRFRI